MADEYNLEHFLELVLDELVVSCLIFARLQAVQDTNDELPPLDIGLR